MYTTTVYLLTSARPSATRFPQYSSARAKGNDFFYTSCLSRPSNFYKVTYYIIEARRPCLSSSKCHANPNWRTASETPEAQYATEVNGSPFDDSHKRKRSEHLYILTHAWFEDWGAYFEGQCRPIPSSNSSPSGQSIAPSAWSSLT
jgi:hypothetical protein